MSAPQLLQASPAPGSAGYIDQVYPVNAVSKLLQVPSSKRVMKIANTPSAGQFLAYSANGAGTVENPDLLTFSSVDSFVVMPATARSVGASQSINLSGGSQMSFSVIDYDNTAGLFGSTPSFITIPDAIVNPRGLMVSAWVVIVTQPILETFDIVVKLQVFDGSTAVDIGINSFPVRSTTVASPRYIGVSGFWVPTGPGQVLQMEIVGINPTGAFPVANLTGGRIEVSTCPF